MSRQSPCGRAAAPGNQVPAEPKRGVQDEGGGVSERSGIGREAFRSLPKPYTYWLAKMDVTQILPS